MRRPIALLLFTLACGGSATGPDGPQAKIRVSPPTATILVGGTQALGAALLNSAGDSTGLASVTWTSSASTIASVSSDGVATGLAPGVTTVMATTSDGALDSARITVVENACDGIASAHLQGTSNFTFTYATQLGQVQYDISNSATMSFSVDSSSPGPNDHRIWFASATGNGTEHETRTDHETDQVETINGNGALVVSGINLSHVILDVDLSACTYTIEGNPYIDVTENPGGDLGPSWIGWYVPLGFSSDFFGEGAPDDGSAGTVTIDYSLARVP